MDVNAIMKRAQALLGNASGSWATPQYLMEPLNQIYEDVYNEFLDINIPFDISVVELLAVPANTLNLNQFQGTGQPLEFMIQPTKVEWKLAGADPRNYRSVDRVDQLRDVLNAAGQSSEQGITEYEFRSFQIFITAAGVAVDLRVRFQVLWAELNSVDATLAIGSTRSFLAYRLASLVCEIRENPKLSDRYKLRGNEQRDLIESNFVKKDQHINRRLGSPARLRRAGSRRSPRSPVN